MNDWISVKDRLPEIGQFVWIYHDGHPNKMNDEYSMYVDGSDRTKKELLHRKSAREWFSKNPYRIAKLYMTAISGPMWTVDFPNDSRYGYIATLDEIVNWQPLPEPPQEGN